MNEFNLNVHIIFLTYEPNFNSSETKNVKKFYEENIVAYSRALSSVVGKLVIVDTASSQTFIDFITQLADKHKISYMLIKENISSFDAFNYYVEQNKNINHIYIWAPSDTRPSKQDWCKTLISDMYINSALLAYPTVTVDGSNSTAQTQKAPLNKDPTKVEFPNYCNLVSCAIHGRLLEMCDWKLPNKYKKNGNDKGLSIIAKATNSTAILSFRANLIHIQNIPGRHQWTNDISRKGREIEYIRQSIIESGLMAFGTSRLHFSTYIKLLEDRGISPIRAFINYLRILLMFIYDKRLRASLIEQYAVSTVVKRNLANLMALPMEERIRVVKEIYWEK